MKIQNISLPFFLFFFFCLTVIAVEGRETERQVEQPLRQAIDVRQLAQKEVDRWRGDKERLTARFEQLEQESELLKARSEELRQSVATTEHRLAEKRQQLAEIERITGEIVPFLDELYGRLQEVSSQGPPFLREERDQRIARLQAVLADPAVSVGERYRRLMEGLLIEAEYGFSTEVYQEYISLGTTPTLVEVFRLGRLNLFYLTLDHTQCGYYNEATKTWEQLAESHLHVIRSAMAMAGKRQPVEFLSLPLGRMGGR